MSGQWSEGQHISARRQAETDSLLRESIRTSGLEGKPLHLGAKTYAADGASLLSGMFGPPAWMLRLKGIEDGRAALRDQVEGAWRQYVRRNHGHPERFTAVWRSFLAGLDLTRLNTLIEKHNAYYPIEARLPIVYPTGEYRLPPGIEWPQQSITAGALLEAFPADLDLAEFFQRESLSGDGDAAGRPEQKQQRDRRVTR